MGGIEHRWASPLRIGGLGVALLAAAAAGASPADGPAFRSESGRFSVRFPGTPRHTTRSHTTPVGRVASGEYLVEQGELELRVELHDVPAIAGFLLSDRALLERAERDLLSDEGAREHRGAAAEVQGHPAREVVYRLPAGDGRAGRALLVLVGARLYILAALHPAGSADESALDGFFESFEVWTGP